MKKLIIILGVFMVLVGTGVYFILPTNINWNEYIQETAAAVKARTGLTLTVQGQPAFSMKPSPVLKLGQIRLGNIQDASYPQMMTAARAEILFDTGSLFRRQIKIKKVTLFSPQFYFETMPNGKWNWQIAFFDRAAANATIGFDSLLLTDGAAEVKTDKYTPAQKWDRVNAELFADSIHGPFFFEGNFGALASSFGFSLKVEKFVSAQSPDFSLRLINAPAEASFVFTGKYGLSETDRGILTGGLTFDIRKPDQFFALLYPQEKLPSVLFQPVVGNLKLLKNAQTRTAEMTDILFKYGTSSATGRLSVRSLSPDEASARQAQEEEEILPDDEIVLRDPNNPSEPVTLDNTPVRQTKLAQNLLPKVVDGSFIFSRLDADPFFDNLTPIAVFLSKTGYFSRTKDTYAFDMLFDVVNYKKDVIHQLKSKISSIPEGVAFKDISATLPSNAYVTGEANLALGKSVLLSGKLSAQADNVSAVLNWLGFPPAEEIPQNLLQQFKAETEFKLAQNGLVLSQLKGRLDQTDFSGSMALRLGNRKALSVSGDFSEMNLAQYFPAKNKFYAQKREEFSKLSATQKIQRLFDSLAFLNDADISLKLKTAAFSWADINAENVNADFAVVRGQMKINEISGEKILASAIKLRGDAEGFGGDPKFSDFTINVNAQQLSSLTQALGIPLSRNVSVQDKMQLSAKLTGTIQAMQFDTVVDFGSLRFSAQGDMRQSAPSVFDWNMNADIHHENFRNFVRLFSDNYRPVLANPGALDLQGRILKNKDLFHLTDMAARIGENEFKGNIKVVRQTDSSVITAELEAHDLAPLGMLPRVNFAETIAVDTQKTVPEDIWTKDGILSRFAADLSFSRKPFDFSFLGKYEASIALKTNRLFFNSFVLSDVDSIIKLSADKIVIDLRRSLWNRANFGGIFTLTPAADGLLDLQTAVRVSNLNIPAKLFDSDTLNVGAVEGLILNANLKAKGKSTNELFSSLTGTGTLTFNKAALDRFNMAQLTEDLQRVPEIAKETIQTQAMQGSTEINRFSANVSVKNGSLILDTTSFAYDGAENKSLTFSYNYLDRILSAGLEFPSGIQSVSNVVLSVGKKTGQPAVLEQTIGAVVDEVAAVKNKMKEVAQQQQEQQRRQEIEAQEKARAARVERLNKLDERLTMASAELAKKIAAVQPLAQKVYQVEKYLLALNNAARTLGELNVDIQKTVSGGNGVLTDAAVAGLEKRAKENYFDKEAEINAGYDTAMIVGIKGTVFDALNQANEILRQEAKLQTTHSDLPEIAQNVSEIMKEIDPLKGIQAQSESDGIKLEELTVLRAQAEVVLDKIKSIHQKTTDAVARKNAKIEAEEKAKREAEEMKKKAEEEAKKAAEVAAAAEKARQEAAERERQRTIFRTDGQSSSSAASSAGQTGNILQTLTPADQGSVAAAEPEKSEKDNPIIIRRR